MKVNLDANQMLLLQMQFKKVRASHKVITRRHRTQTMKKMIKCKKTLRSSRKSLTTKTRELWGQFSRLLINSKCKVVACLVEFLLQDSPLGFKTPEATATMVKALSK